jgi:predicted methyltransferase
VLASTLPVLPAQRARAAQQRDAWQRPAEVMDALGIVAGSRVADVGCGEGYFVLHLAERVGPEGTVYAVDIDEEVLEVTRRKAERAGFSQVRIVLGEAGNPKLPAGELDAVLIVNAYHEMQEYNAMLGAIYRALKPGGRLAIIDAEGKGQDRSTLMREHRITVPIVRQDAERNGFRFREERPGFDRPGRRGRHFFFLIFEKPNGAAQARQPVASLQISQDIYKDKLGIYYERWKSSNRAR